MSQNPRYDLRFKELNLPFQRSDVESPIRLFMIDQEKLQRAVVQAILPYVGVPENDEDPENDPFAVEAAKFLTQELIHSKVDISEDQAELDYEGLENLPITQILTPYLNDLLSPQDPVSIISSIIQIYMTSEPKEKHPRVQYGPCEVFLPFKRLQ